MSRRIGACASERRVLGAGGRLEGGPAPELGRPASPTRSTRRTASPRGSRWPTSPTRSCWPRPARSPRTTPALIGGLLDLDAMEASAPPWRPELGDAFNSREAALTELVGPSAAGWSARPPAPRGVPRRPAAVRPRRDARGARRGARRRDRPDRARRAPRPGPRRRLHLPPAGPAHDDRPPPAGLRRPGAARRRAPARVPRPAGPERRGAGGARGRAGRSTASGWPSCSAARGSSSTPRTPCGRPTPTPSSLRRCPSRRPTARSSPRTSRSSPAGVRRGLASPTARPRQRADAASATPTRWP